MNIKDAARRHGTVRRVLETWRTDRGATLALEGAWGAATATADNGQAMASAVRIAIPLEYIPLFRMADCVPAAFFLDCLSTALTSTPLDANDIADTFRCAEVCKVAIDAFEARRQQADNIQEGFGCDQSAAWATLRKCDDKSPELAVRMAEVAKLAGRMFKALRYEGTPKPCPTPDFVNGVEGGDDVGRLLDEEVALLNVEGANADALTRLEDKQATQLQMQGTTPHGRGPLVIALDESGSMHEHRLVWSKAAAVALARVALAEGRRVRVVHFSTSTVLRDLDLSDPDSIRELAWHRLGGGTDVEAAMRAAVQQVLELEADGIVGADIVFVTDGECRYTEAPFIEMKKHGIQLWTVAIDIDFAQQSRYGSTPYLHSYATKYLHISDSTVNRGDGSSVGELRTAALDNVSREELN